MPKILLFYDVSKDTDSYTEVKEADFKRALDRESAALVQILGVSQAGDTFNTCTLRDGSVQFMIDFRLWRMLRTIRGKDIKASSRLVGFKLGDKWYIRTLVANHHGIALSHKGVVGYDNR